MINMNAYNKINASQRGIYIEGVIFKTNDVSLPALLIAIATACF